MVYNIVKHFIEEDTKQKIVIMGGNLRTFSLSLSYSSSRFSPHPLSLSLSLSSDNWQEELQQYIAPDQLPKAYGGTRCEPDPQCTAHVRGIY